MPDPSPSRPQPPVEAPLLIVNADDYGLTEGVSRAIIDAHHRGVVSSTSVLALAPGFARTVSWLQDAPNLGTGAHLALVGEDPPLLSSSEVPTLVDRQGNLRRSWREFLPLAAAGRIDPDDIGRELAAQYEAIVGAGVTVDHFDTHQNLHLWPSVRDAVLELGEQHDIRVIRVTRSTAFSVVGGVVQRLARALERRCDRLGWTYAQASTGLDEAGVLDEPAMISALFRLAGTGASSAELATHPGGADDPDRSRYRWDYRWAEEHHALCSPGVRAAVSELGWQLGTFGDLAVRQLPDDGTPR